jgi:hypothetical protein
MALVCAWLGCCALAVPANEHNRTPNRSVGPIDRMSSFMQIPLWFSLTVSPAPETSSTTTEPASGQSAAAEAAEALLRAAGTRLTKRGGYNSIGSLLIRLCERL